MIIGRPTLSDLARCAWWHLTGGPERDAVRRAHELIARHDREHLEAIVRERDDLRTALGQLMIENSWEIVHCGRGPAKKLLNGISVDEWNRLHALASLVRLTPARVRGGGNA